MAPVIGELVRAVRISDNVFSKKVSALKGMNETTVTFEVPSANADMETLKKKIYETCNVLQVPSIDDGYLKFAGQTLSSSSLLLLLVQLSSTTVTLSVNCEKIVIGNMLAKDLQVALESA